MARASSRPSVLTPRANSLASVRLFCFPYAGGGASVFRGWADELPGVEVTIANLPGRGMPFDEPSFTCIPELVQVVAEAVEPQLDRPFAVFGHSFGALLAFELARELRRRGWPVPAHLFVSAFRAPQLARRHSAIHQLPDAELIHAVRQRYNGIPRAVLEDAELLALTLPTLRADLRLHEGYRYEPEPPLDCGISAMAGAQDPLVAEWEAAAWAAQTRTRFTLELLSGDHFFVTADPKPLLAIIQRELQQLMPQASGGGYL